MAKKAKAKSNEKETANARDGGVKRKSASSAASDGGSEKTNAFHPGAAVIRFLQSPLVAELVAVAATAALAALAEHGFTGGAQGTRGKRAGKAVKEASKAAAAAVGRRLTTEMDEIRKAATNSKGDARA